MITLVLEACKIPEGMKVRKVTGEKYYTLTRELKVFGQTKDQHVEVKVPKDILFIIAGTSISIVQPGDKFALDFNGPQDVMNFVDENLISHQ